MVVQLNAKNRSSHQTFSSFASAVFTMHNMLRCLLLLLATVGPAKVLFVNGFTSSSVSVIASRTVTMILPRPCRRERTTPWLSPTALYSGEEPPPPPPSSIPVSPENNNNSNDADPRKALEQFGSLFTQVQAILTEGNSWDADTLETKTQDLARTYVQVFVPGMGYVASSWIVYLGTFAVLELGLFISGRGYGDVLAATQAIAPLLYEFLRQTNIPPTWGNVGVGLVGLEVLSPVILAVTLALTPQMMKIVRTKLQENGWGEQDIDARVAELLAK